MENKNCRCKKGEKGNNFIPDRITLKGENGTEITNRDLMCHHCAYKKRGDTLACLRFEKKPKEVLAGGKCEAFLSSGHDLGKKNRGCDDCGDCGNGCGSCNGECTGCGGCEN